jgi:hypothetical protein
VYYYLCCGGAIADLTIQIRGSKKLLAKLKRLENPSKVVARGMQNYLGKIDDELKARPPESAANRSPGINGYSWYKRRYGTHTITGKKYKTSQDMGVRWGIKTKVRGSGVRSTIVNKATYSPFVIGDRQVGFHKRRGWKVASETVERTLPDALEQIGKAVDKELSK